MSTTQTDPTTGPAPAGDQPGGDADDPWTPFRNLLIGEGLLIPTGVDGIYGRSGTYESVADAMDRLVLRVGADQDATSVRFPPVMPWATFERNGYLESFPDQMGSVHTFRGNERDHVELLRRTEEKEDRAPMLTTTDMVLCPAVCHPLYPTMGGVLPEGGRRFEVYGYCFRCEPSTDPFRMQSFRQHDYVYLGTPEGRGPIATCGSSGASTSSAAWVWRSRRWWPTIPSSDARAGCWPPTSATRS